MVHRGKQADGPHPQFGHGAMRALRRVGGGRIEHEEADEPRGMPSDRFCDGCFVARNAGDERRASNTAAIELLNPSIRERFGCARSVPSKRRDDVTGRLLRSRRTLMTERVEKLLREKVTMAVVHGVAMLSVARR
jgi:hypothetical protein